MMTKNIERGKPMKNNHSWRKKRRSHFWRKTLSTVLATTMLGSHFPVFQVAAYGRTESEDWQLPEGIEFADLSLGSYLAFEDAQIYDPEVLEELLALRGSLMDGLVPTTSVGAVGFEGDFALDTPDALINIAVQFMTPPVEALRILSQESHPAIEAFASARTDTEFEVIALSAHADFASQLSNLGGARVRAAAPQIISSHMALFNGVFMTVPQSMVEDIAALPEVFAVTPELTFYAISDLENLVVNDDEFAYIPEVAEDASAATWAPTSSELGVSPSDYFMREALEALGIAELVEASGLTGEDIRVGVLDTGIDYYHPAFYSSRYDLDGAVSHRGWDFVANRRSPMEARPDEVPPWASNEVGPTTHGTHVAGSVVAIAPGVTLYHYRVLFGGTPAHIITQGIERAFADNVDIMNLSLGAPVNQPFAPDTYMLNLASLSGIVVIIAAGNSGYQATGTIGTPGVASLPITVGNAQLGGVGFRRLDGGADVDGQNIFMEVRGNQFFFETESIAGEFDWINLGQISGIPERPTEAFVQAFRDEYLDGGDLEGRIAVVLRGGTPFTSMRNLVQALNGGGLIIVDNQPVEAVNSLANINILLDGPSGATRVPIFATRQAYLPNFGSVGNTGSVTFGELYYVPLTDNMNASSSRGPISVSYHISPDVVAPGTRIVSAVPSFAVSPNPADWDNHRYAYQPGSGTSMAAPAVAGVVALMLEAFPDATPWEIKARLMGTARPLEGIPSATAQSVNGGDFYSVLNVGAGFVRPALALDAETAFATVVNPIPWLEGGVPSWARHTQSALSFGNVTGSFSEERTIEIHNPGTGYWTPAIIWNGSNVGASLVLLASTETTFTFQLRFDKGAAERFFEGNVIFTNGSAQVTVPFGGNNGREPLPLYGSPIHLGIARPVISGFVLEYEGQVDIREARTEEVGALTASNSSLVMFNIQEPGHESYRVVGVQGPARPTLFYAVRYDEEGNRVDYFVAGVGNIPTNTYFNLSGFLSASFNGHLLEEGVYTFYADVLDPLSPTTIEIGQFVITNQVPEVRFSQEVFYFYTHEPVQVEGYLYSFGHELAIEHGITTAEFTYSAGGNPVFDYRFINWVGSGIGNLTGTVSPRGQFAFSFSPGPATVALALEEEVSYNTRLIEALGLSGWQGGPTLVGGNIADWYTYLLTIRALEPQDLGFSDFFNVNVVQQNIHELNYFLGAQRNAPVTGVLSFQIEMEYGSGLTSTSMIRRVWQRENADGTITQANNQNQQLSTLGLNPENPLTLTSNVINQNLFGPAPIPLQAHQSGTWHLRFFIGDEMIAEVATVEVNIQPDPALAALQATFHYNFEEMTLQEWQYPLPDLMPIEVEIDFTEVPEVTSFNENTIVRYLWWRSSPSQPGINWEGTVTLGDLGIDLTDPDQLVGRFTPVHHILGDLGAARWLAGDYNLTLTIVGAPDFVRSEDVTFNIEPLPEGNITFERINFPERLYTNMGTWAAPNNVSFDVRFEAGVDPYYTVFMWLLNGHPNTATFRGNEITDGLISRQFNAINGLQGEWTLIAWTYAEGNLYDVRYVNTISSQLIFGEPPVEEPEPVDPITVSSTWNVEQVFRRITGEMSGHIRPLDVRIELAEENDFTTATPVTRRWVRRAPDGNVTQQNAGTQTFAQLGIDPTNPEALVSTTLNTSFGPGAPFQNWAWTTTSQTGLFNFYVYVAGELVYRSEDWDLEILREPVLDNLDITFGNMPEEAARIREWQHPLAEAEEMPTITFDFGEVPERTLLTADSVFRLNWRRHYLGGSTSNFTREVTLGDLGIDLTDSEQLVSTFNLLELGPEGVFFGASRWLSGTWDIQVQLVGYNPLLAESEQFVIEVQTLPEGEINFTRVDFPQYNPRNSGDFVAFEIGIETEIDFERIMFGWLRNGFPVNGVPFFRGTELEDHVVRLGNPSIQRLDSGYWELVAWTYGLHEDGTIDLYTVISADSIGTFLNVDQAYPTPDDPIGDEPVNEEPAYPTWTSESVFNTGDRVIHNGHVFEAQWWTQNQEPGTSPWGAWMEIGAAVYFDGRYVPTWTDSNVFDTGDVVYYDGYFFRAQWWTRNQSPSTPWGPWQNMGPRNQ